MDFLHKAPSVMLSVSSLQHGKTLQGLRGSYLRTAVLECNLWEKDSVLYTCESHRRGQFFFYFRKMSVTSCQKNVTTCIMITSTAKSWKRKGWFQEHPFRPSWVFEYKERQMQCGDADVQPPRSQAIHFLGFFGNTRMPYLKTMRA